MLLTLLAIIAIIVLALVGLKFIKYNEMVEVLCAIFMVFGFVSLFVYGFVSYKYIASEHKMNIINREYGTSYTQEEVFYASDVIDMIREIDRQRIELNGNLVTGKNNKQNEGEK